MARVRLGRLPSTEAQTARLALEQASIPVELVGEQLSALQGAIPQAEVLVEVWVASEQREQAQRIVATTLSGTSSKTAGEVRCPNCAAANPGNFELCWQCQADLAAASPEPQRAPSPSKRMRPSSATLLFALTTVVLAVLLWREKQLPKAVPSGPFSWQWSSEDCLDQLVGGVLVSRGCDKNRDEVFERTESFDKKGHVQNVSYDADEDGFAERVDAFDAQGNLMSRAFDLDGDWRFERVDEFDPEEKLSRRGTFDGNGRNPRMEYFAIDGAELARGEGTDLVIWKKDRSELRLVYSRSWPRLADLVITSDGGVMRRQVLTVEGWVDELK